MNILIKYSGLLFLALKYPCSGGFCWVRTHMLAAATCLWDRPRFSTGGQRHPGNLQKGSKGVKSSTLIQATSLNTPEMYSPQFWHLAQNIFNPINEKEDLVRLRTENQPLLEALRHQLSEALFWTRGAKRCIFTASYWSQWLNDVSDKQLLQLFSIFSRQVLRFSERDYFLSGGRSFSKQWRDNNTMIWSNKSTSQGPVFLCLLTPNKKSTILVTN